MYRCISDCVFLHVAYSSDTIHNSPSNYYFNKLSTLPSQTIHLTAPTGWKKDRHKLYPTTDLNLVTDPFEPQDREWLASILDARLSPMMERAYGVYRGAIRANDIFVVRYDGKDKDSEGQDRLRKHTDSSHFSFNVLLNTEFEGGGTR